MIDTWVIIKCFSIGGCFLLAGYKLVASIEIFDKEDPFNEKRRDYLDAEDRIANLKYLKYARFFMIMIAFSS